MYYCAPFITSLVTRHDHNGDHNGAVFILSFKHEFDIQIHRVFSDWFVIKDHIHCTLSTSYGSCIIIMSDSIMHTDNYYQITKLLSTI